MADRQVTQQTILTLLNKLTDPDADLRYMSLNDLYGILNSSQSSFIANDRRLAQGLADGLFKALDDQHGEVQNQALKWYVLDECSDTHVTARITNKLSLVLVPWRFVCPSNSSHPFLSN